MATTYKIRFREDLNRIHESVEIWTRELVGENWVVGSWSVGRSFGQSVGRSVNRSVTRLLAVIVMERRFRTVGRPLRAPRWLFYLGFAFFFCAKKKGTRFLLYLFFSLVNDELRCFPTSYLFCLFL